MIAFLIYNLDAKTRRCYQPSLKPMFIMYLLI